jgi:hypothetical protein
VAGAAADKADAQGSHDQPLLLMLLLLLLLLLLRLLSTSACMRTDLCEVSCG